MEIGGEIGYGGGDAGIEGTTEGEVTAETHAGGADAAVAGWEGEEVGDREGRVFIVGG